MTKDWWSIVAHYDALGALNPSILGIAALARHIQESELAVGLFAWTSMSDLCIVQAEVSYPYEGPYLRVAPRADGTIEFRYIDTMVEADQWHRTVAAADVIPRLRRFLAELNWFAARTR